MRRFEVHLNIPSAQMLRYYQGAAGTVITSDRFGRRIRFPASALRPFVTASGVHGRFLLDVDQDNRLRRLRALP